MVWPAALLSLASALPITQEGPSVTYVPPGLPEEAPLVVGRTADEHVLAVVSGGRVEEIERFDPDEMDWSDVEARAVVGRLRAGAPWQVLVTTRGASWQGDGRSRVLLIPGR